MYFVEHPGYCKPYQLNFRKNGFIFFTRIISRRFGYFRGSWENNHQSTAYVSKSARNTYLHGAFWVGAKKSFLEFARICAESTESDAHQGIIARWHDESHLNQYFTRHGGEILSQRFSWHIKYSKILPDNPILESREDFGKSR